MISQPSPYAAKTESRVSGVPAADALRDRFFHVRRVTERLAAPLSAEDCTLQSMPDASPTKWHLAHTSWFFETFLLEKFAADFTPFDPAFRVLFNSYYNGVGDKHPRPERGLISRPDFATILDYRHHVTERIAALLLQMAQHADFAALMWLGCHHEEQHQELILTDLKHLLSKNPLKPAYEKRWPLTPIDAISRPTLTRVGQAHACRAKRNGKSRQRHSRPPATFSKTTRCIRWHCAWKPPPMSPRRCSAMSGSGRKAPTFPIPGSRLRAVPWVNTTGNSCATRLCCVGAPA